jgi:heme-degrading monooxygenase HmoA
MVIVVFRSRIRAEHAAEYYALVEDMEKIARAMPGYVSNKAYMSEDGERLSIHEWESAEHLRAWREHPDHAKAQALGRREFYEEYTLYACENPRESRFRR